MTAPTVVRVVVPVLPYGDRTYRAGRRVLMPMTDARRLAARGCVVALEDTDDTTTETT